MHQRYDLQPGRLLHPRPDRDLPVQILSGPLNKFKRGCSEKSLQPRQLFKAPRVLNTSAYGSGVKQAHICRICRCAADRASYGRYTGNRSVLPINGLPGADRAWLPRIYENLKQRGGADITAYEDGIARRCSFNTNRPNAGRPCESRAFRRCLQDLCFMTRQTGQRLFSI